MLQENQKEEVQPAKTQGENGTKVERRRRYSNERF